MNPALMKKLTKRATEQLVGTLLKHGKPDELMQLINPNNTPQANQKLVTDILKREEDSNTKNGKSTSWRQYTPTKGERAALDIVIPVLGDAAKGVGSSMGTYHAMLGNALDAMAGRQSQARREKYGPSPVDTAAAIGGNALKARGAIETLVGNLFGDRLQTIADTVKGENAAARAQAYYDEARPSGGYYQFQTRQLSQGKK